MSKKPEILSSSTLAKTNIFQIDAIHLRFSNGVERNYERLKEKARGVIVVPIYSLTQLETFLIREYGAGIDAYTLTLPKGFINSKEDILDAANRELMEEIGYGAKQLTHLTTLTIAPGYMNALMEVVIAQDLYVQRLEGDEPEPLEVIPWSLHQLTDLVAKNSHIEARAIAALFLAREYLLNPSRNQTISLSRHCEGLQSSNSNPQH